MDKNNKEFFEPEEVSTESVSTGKKIWNWIKTNKYAVGAGVLGTLIGAAGMKEIKDHEIADLKESHELELESAAAVGKLTGMIEAWHDFTSNTTHEEKVTK